MFRVMVKISKLIENEFRARCYFAENRSLKKQANIRDAGPFTKLNP